MLTYNLEMRGEETRYHYLYTCIKHDIESEIIPAYTKLPSKRKLAEHLSTSLITVETAYEQLISEGYIRAEPRRGYYVNTLQQSMLPHCTPDLQAANSAPSQPDKTFSLLPDVCLDSTVFSESKEAYAYCKFDLSQGQLSAKYFPYTSWGKAAREVIAQEAMALTQLESDTCGLLPLKVEIARHLMETRGLCIEPQHIVIGAGAQILYNLIIQLLGPSIHVGLEDPGYPRLSKIYTRNGIPVSHIPLDESGLVVDALKQSAATIAHIMPSHQFPTGIIMPISRRYELLSWATEKENRYIIEDDYDCEFKLAGVPVPTLKGIDTNEHVIYTNTFSKGLGSAVRIAYMVLPKHLAKRFRSELDFYSCTVSIFDQLALATFMKNGSYERFINKTKTKCRTIRNSLIDALSKRDINHHLTFSCIDSGLHFILSIPYTHNADDFKKALRMHGVLVHALSDYMHFETYLGKTNFIINYPNISLNEIDDLADVIYGAYTQTAKMQSISAATRSQCEY